MHEIHQQIYQAALQASRAMGNDLLKMSCFVSNWAQIVADRPTEAVLEATTQRLEAA